VEVIETIVDVGNEYVWGFPAKLPWLVVLLLGAGLFVTLRLLFIQVRHFRHGWLVVIGRYDDPDDPGDINHFQALSTALSATVGVGNIAGVATAIHYGGPGAVFWMWVTAFFGMALKFAECTLSLHYRVFDERGDASGGPMYYIERGLGRSWKPLAVVFAFCGIISSFGSGNMNQANTVAVSAATDFNASKFLVGIILVLLVGGVILGGIRSIAKVSSRLAPTMALVYVAAALVILVLNAGDVPGAFATIIGDAFTPRAGVGGSVAGLFSVTLLWGVKRGLFSNEAGQGSAPIAHAAAKTDEPVREGAVAMLGPFIDTLVICTMTALVIVITGVWDEKKPGTVALGDVAVVVKGASADSDEQASASVTAPVSAGRQEVFTFEISDGPVDEAMLMVGDKALVGELVYDPVAESIVARDRAGNPVDVELHGEMLQNSSALTSWAFERGLSPIGDWGSVVVTLCVFLFALSTMISWSYYGDRCVTYLFGVKYVLLYRAIYIGFVYLGATTALDIVWAYGDLALGLMSVPNLIAVMLLTPKLLELTRDYFARMKEKNGG
jgi:AGCS family alanine or glycine:cation symporter